MGEVGEQGPLFHAEAARYAQSRGIEQLFLIGDLSQSAAFEFAGARHFDDYAQLNTAVAAAVPHLSSILVKGSRFMRMEQVVEYLTGESKC